MSAQFLHDVLVPLSDAFYKQADAILDLREYALSKQNPGRCVSCYFKLFSAARGDKVRRLQALRKWLETNLVVVARDEQDRLLERIPLYLDEGDLESFCQRMLQEVVHNRVYNSKRIELQFAFKGESLAA
ncbi:hypothetical protein H5P28_04940 [Ruficoccus amylovorans]|uniref:Uncharacterized protein n=1 Tax=Ruficoccus amylovorans TaxID=1804625 RepID=A0A842HAU8_9BACT|nr:hypothetical protein [Ruficoccus amylovorans]MBC2593603.1 hypothetical protein [Ruficoccus amylovorans]